MSSKELAVRENPKVQVIPGFGSLQSFELIQRAATLLSKSSLVPKEYQGNLPNCVIALNIANRLQADPLMVMQNLYIVHGKPGWSSQFLISTFNACGRFTALRYEWSGKPNTDEWGCKAWAIEKETGQKLEGSTITIGMAKDEGWYGKSGSKWKTMPQQMLMYRAASWFIRAYAPELAMGIYTEDEIIDIEDAEVITVETEIKEKANKEFADIENNQETPKPEQQEPPKNDKQPEDNSQQGLFGGQQGPDF